MENLNAEQVKSELEGLANYRTCPEYIKNALSLITSQEQRIKELAEVVERSKTAQGCEESVNNGFSPSVTELQRENERLRLKDAENAVSAFRDAAAILALQERLKKTTKENEGLHRICQSYVLQYGTATDKEIFLKKERAETVRKMAESIKLEFYREFDEIIPSIMADRIDQIAKEMLEGEK